MRPNALLLAALLIPDGPSDVVIKGFHMVQSRREKEEFSLRAIKADVYRKEDFYVLELPRSSIRSDKDNSTFDVEGSRAFFDAAENKIFIEADSQIRTPEDLIFKTKSLSIDTKKKILKSDDDVEVFQQIHGEAKSLFNLKGKGLLVDIREGKYNILANASAQKLLGPGDVMRIHSKESYYDSVAQVLVFSRSVTLRSEKYNVDGDRIIVAISYPKPGAPKIGKNKLRKKVKKEDPKTPSISNLRVESDTQSSAVLKDGTQFRAKGLDFKLNENGDIEESNAIGSAYAELPGGARLKAEKLQSITRDGEQVILLKDTVEIRVDSKIATCENGEYYPGRGDFVLEDIASINDGNQTINGEKIRFSMKDDSVVVERASGQLKRNQLDSKKRNPGK